MFRMINICAHLFDVYHSVFLPNTVYDVTTVVYWQLELFLISNKLKRKARLLFTAWQNRKEYFERFQTQIDIYKLNLVIYLL